MNHEISVSIAVNQALDILRYNKLKFTPMARKENRVNTKRGFVIGRTNLKTGSISIDIFTPKTRKPKKISSILTILCHEVAHHQKRPYRQRYKGRIIIRKHFPVFYRQVKRNIAKLKKDKILKNYFA